MKKKITVRFVIERDFEVTVKDEKLGLGSAFCIGDNMVMSGHDCHNLIEEESIFDNPVGDFRVFQNRHIYDANIYNITNNMLDGELSAWLYDTETDPDPYAEELEE